MTRIAGLLFGALSYGIFFATFLYAMAFVADLWVPRSISTDPAELTITVSRVAEVLLLALHQLAGVEGVPYRFTDKYQQGECYRQGGESGQP